MIGRLARGLLAALLVAASVALGVGIAALLGPLPPETRGETPVQGAAAPGAAAPAPVSAAPPIETFEALFTRPLFRPDRRPPAPPPPEEEETETAPDAPEEEATLDAELRGVVFAGGGGFALVASAEGGAPVRLAPGDLFLGWRLAALAPAAATFERDGATVTLELGPGRGAAPEE